MELVSYLFPSRQQYQQVVYKHLLPHPHHRGQVHFVMKLLRRFKPQC